MSALFAFSYAALVGLVVSEALALREVLIEGLSLKRLIVGLKRREQLPFGTLAPAFSAPVLGTREEFNTSQLAGKASILLFVSTSQAVSSLYAKLHVVVHVLWHKAEGRLVLICDGGEEQCARLVADRGIDPFSYAHPFTLLLDPGLRIAASFGVRRTPQAVMLTEDLRVNRYGLPKVNFDETGPKK